MSVKKSIWETKNECLYFAIAQKIATVVCVVEEAVIFSIINN